MADGHESLGKASLDLTANIEAFRRQMREGRASAGGMRDSLEAVAEISKIAEEALHRVKMTPGQGAESRASMEGILEGVRGIKDESREAAREMDHVRISEAQAAESKAAAKQIADSVDNIGDQARQTDRALSRVTRRLLEARALSLGAGGNRPGYGVGPFGAGYGRLGVFGTAVAAGALLTPAAGPGALGLLGAIPTLSFGAAGALGTLVLAFQGVGKAIGGDKKAFDELTPSAQKFVLQVRSLDGWLDRLKETAGSALFPGLSTGLRSALSPGTTGVIERGVGQFGTAIGSSAALWGRFIGSPQFQRLLGPLLTAGAQGFRILSGAALQFFYALSIVGRAAIPFTLWLERSLELGARLSRQFFQTQAASGGLARGFSEARMSLTLVWNLFTALIRVVAALGRALYPVSKVLLVQLTAGLNWLARTINQNRNGISAFVNGALQALVSILRVLVPLLVRIIGFLGSVVRVMGGWKTAFQIVITGFLASRFLILGKSIFGAEIAAKGLRTMLLSLGSPAVLLALGDVVATLGAAYLAYKAFKGATESVAGDHMIYTKFFGQVYAAQKGSRLGDILEKIAHHKKLTAGDKQDLSLGLSTGNVGVYPTTAAAKAAGATAAAVSVPKSATKKDLIPGTHAWYIANLGFDPTAPGAGAGVFGAVPPFTKNVGGAGTPSVIPGTVSQLLALASEDASRASVLNDKGAKAKRFLQAELGKLGKADQLLHAKYAAATGKARTTLFNEIARVENKMRTVRKQIAAAIKSSQSDDLQLALDTAKLAVQNAQQGSKAYDDAVAAEAKALRAEISYWDKRAHNRKLAADVRDAAIRKEIGYKKQLAALLKPQAQAGLQNESQFLSSFKDIMSAFAPNAFPGSGGKTDTHLYDLVQESRETNDHLRDIRAGQRFPASRYAVASAAAVTG